MKILLYRAAWSETASAAALFEQATMTSALSFS
jgi:hypothetical protein